MPPERPSSYPPQNIVILGAGRFGKLAAVRLKKRLPDSRIKAVDRRQDRVEELRDATGLDAVPGDAIRYLTENSLPDDLWVIPAVPVHVAFQFALGKLKDTGVLSALPVPGEVDAQVPNPQRAPSGTVYASFATFICPDFCSEPEETCTFTGKPRLGVLFDVLGAMRVPDFEIAVVRSWQLAPGVGGYPLASLQELTARIAQNPGSYVVATACRCHGVIDALVKS